MTPFTCPRCGHTTHHPLDAHEGYCGACHDWTGDGSLDALGHPRMRSMHYDRDGLPLTLREWALRLEDAEYRIVERSEVDGWIVSTVWLGINHRFTPGPPLIFETMVMHSEMTEPSLLGDVPVFDDFQMRYPTEPAARAGHDRIVAAMRDERHASEAWRP
ncbi:MAG TPA: hypothetical protein VHS03_12475, partial [Gaiellaceae bacterium]|nr:hypothetical protein [Gaiellaceae bacterium]